MGVPKPLLARERRAMASRNPASGEAEEAAIFAALEKYKHFE